MAASVLFDAPGPVTKARHRIYTVIASFVLAAIVAFALWKLYDDGQFEYELWEPFVTTDYITAILEGLLATVSMAVLAVLGAVVLGLILGVAKLSDHWFARWPGWVIVEFFRATPVLLLMVFFYLTYLISVEGEIFVIPSESFGGFLAVVFALTLYNGAVLAEVFRAGVNAVPKGQAEAAYAIGMRKTQVMNIVLLPQAIKIMLPAIVSQMVVALKDTSLGYAVLAPGLTKIGQQIYKEFGNQVPTMFVIAGMYIVLNLILTWLATILQKKLVGEKKALDITVIAGGQADAATKV